jgi:hypothetical protein
VSDYLKLLGEFRSEVPAANDATVERVLTRITAGAPTRRRSPLGRFGRRQRLTLVIAFAALLLAAASVAAVREGPWWNSGGPPVDPQAVASVARDNMPANVNLAEARTVVTSGDAALVAVPLNATGYCLIPAIDGRARLGAPCEYQVTDPASGDDDRTLSVTRKATPKDAAVWIVYGRITDPRATKIDLGPFALDLATGGFFLGQVPEGEWSRLSGTATSGSILDGSGSVLRKGCVNWAVAPLGTAKDGDFPVPLWSDAHGGKCEPQKVPVLPTVELGTAKKLFDVTLTQNYSIWKAGQTVVFDAAQRSDGKSCLIATGGPGTPRGFNFSRGCGAVSGGTNAQHPINVGIGAGLTHVDGRAVYTWDISGAVDPGSNISKLELRSGSETTAVTFGGGFFFAQLPVTTPGPQQGTLSMPPGHWLLIGLDVAGKQVAQIDLVGFHRQASPH